MSERMDVALLGKPSASSGLGACLATLNKGFTCILQVRPEISTLVLWLDPVLPHKCRVNAINYTAPVSYKSFAIRSPSSDDLVLQRLNY